MNDLDLRQYLQLKKINLSLFPTLAILPAYSCKMDEEEKIRGYDDRIYQNTREIEDLKHENEKLRTMIQELEKLIKKAPPN